MEEEEEEKYTDALVRSLPLDLLLQRFFSPGTRLFFLDISAASPQLTWLSFPSEGEKKQNVCDSAVFRHSARIFPPARMATWMPPSDWFHADTS